MTSRFGPTPLFPGAAGIAPPVSDPSFTSTVLLLGFNGANGNGTVDDESFVNHADVFGQVGINAPVADTSVKKFGVSSFIFNGSGFIEWADGNEFALGAGDFTLECFVRFNNLTGFQTIYSQWESVANHSILFDWAPNNLRVGLATNTSGADTFIQAAWTPSTGIWYHVCVERSSNTIRLYVDGAVIGTPTAYAGTLFNSSQNPRVGFLPTAGNGFKGYMDELRLTKGVARYSGAFTVPSAAYPRS